MNCERFTTIVHELADGALGPEERKEAEAHREACATCQAAFERVKRLESVISKGAALPDMTDARLAAERARILASARASLPVSSRRRLLAPGVLAIAVVATGTFAASRATLWLGPPAPAQAPPVPAGDASPGSRPAPPPLTPTPDEVGGPSSPVREDPPAPVDTRATNAAPLVEGPRPTLRDDSDHLLLVTDESVAAAAADTPRERVEALLQASSDRLRDLGVALRGADTELVEELAQSYALLLDEGVSVVLADPEVDEGERIDAGGLARAQAAADEFTLAQFERTSDGKVKASLHEALLACRRVGGQ